MDQSKLLQIIIKDLDELKGLTDELIQSEDLSKIEIEIALSKSKLIFQEFELLKENAFKRIIEAGEKSAEALGNTITSTIEPIQLSDNGNSKEAEADLKETKTEEENIKEEDSLKKGIQDEIVENKKEIIKEEIIDTEEEGLTEERSSFKPEAAVAEDELNMEDEVEDEPAIIVGETFAKGKSLNDTLSENQTIDQKFARSPILKLEPAIGLNDRFLFIRELFEGKSDKFSEAVNTLDNFNNLEEAVDFLSTNYKWKKTEASLKFVELVKRRFQS